MHILVTNDDGPPSPTSSPYVHSLVRELQKAGHTVSVCLPHTQRSWIGKAHVIGQTVKPLYYRPSATFDPRPSAADTVQGTTHSRPSEAGEEEWVLVDGTPASAAQIGLHHFFRDRGPIDLVVSGPNYGRNTTAVFALSSGTLGGALEAAVCRKRAIALSYAFFSRNHDPAIIDGASKHAARVIETLYGQWPEDGSIDLYTVNVPLVEGVGANKTVFTGMLQNYWEEGTTCFQEVEAEISDGDEDEERIREGEQAAEGIDGAPENGDDIAEKKKGLAHRHFRWAPRFADVFRSVEESPPGNDGWCVKEGLTSVTPMKANFWHAATNLHGSELKLQNSSSPEGGEAMSLESTLPVRPKAHFFALVAYDDPYVQPLILAALQKLFPPEAYTLLSMPEAEAAEGTEVALGKLLPGDESRVLQITPYEAIDWEFVSSHPDTCLVNSYMLRKALIRKHYLSSTVEHWVSKRPDSVLKDHVKRTEAFELDYAEFLDDALIEAFDLRASLEKNEGLEEEGRADEKEWWILKPGMSDRGQGIRLFSTMEQLQAIFDGWEEERPDSDEDDEDAGEDEDDDYSGCRDFIMASHLRHFVAQPYIHPPLLLPGDNRKFHIRTYVVCVGSLDVYVYRDMLALFAGRPYAAPQDGGGTADLESHLTNTCLQRSVGEGTVRRFWDLDLDLDPEGGGLPADDDDAKQAVFEQVCGVAGEVFEAAARAMPMHFRPLPNAFEVFGLDFLVDARGAAWLLEVNAFPDFRQTGDDLRGLVAGLWEGVLRLAVGPLFGLTAEGGRGDAGGGGKGGLRDMVHVRRVDLGRR
ncbi:hypothetical protein DL763_008540 [Monosporascus cannonballus]|nr:hypothetical protein DL763_008540 [Monosporascus cannonballus]